MKTKVVLHGGRLTSLAACAGLAACGGGDTVWRFPGQSYGISDRMEF